jgi:hypothetical protein
MSTEEDVKRWEETGEVAELPESAVALETPEEIAAYRAQLSKRAAYARLSSPKTPVADGSADPQEFPLGLDIEGYELTWGPQWSRHLFIVEHNRRGKTATLNNILLFALQFPEEWEVTIISVGENSPLSIYKDQPGVEYIDFADQKEFLKRLEYVEIRDRERLLSTVPRAALHDSSSVMKRRLIVVDDVNNIPHEDAEYEEWVHNVNMVITFLSHTSRLLGVHFVFATSDVEHPFIQSVHSFDIPQYEILHLGTFRMSDDTSSPYCGSDGLIMDSSRIYRYRGYQLDEAEVRDRLLKLKEVNSQE